MREYKREVGNSRNRNQHSSGSHPQTSKVQEKISMGCVPARDDSYQK